MTDKPAYDVEDHIRLRRVGAIAASPDGQWLAVAVQRLDRDGVKYVSDLWRVPTGGGEPVQLTRGESNDVAPCFRHDGALGFLSNRQPTNVDVKPDEDADKRMQVWILPVAGGEAVQLTDEPLGIEAFRFAAKADRLLAFAPVLAGVEHAKQRETAAERAKKGTSLRTFRAQPVRHWDHWLHQGGERPHTHLLSMTALGQQRTDLTPAAGGEFDIEPQLDLSADGRRAACTWRATGDDRVSESRIALFDLDGGQRTEVAHDRCTDADSPLFSPDGRRLAFVRTTRSPQDVVRPTLVVLDEAGQARELARAWDRWPSPGAWSQDGRQLLVTADDEGVVPVFAIDAATGDVQRLTAGAGAHAGLVALPGGGFACSRSTLLEPPECHVHDGRPGSTTRALAPLSAFAGAQGWAETESITTLSDDGTPIQSWITRPKGGGAPGPVLLWIHGGPIGMSGDGWHWRWNALLAVARGYTVVQPNPRGSTGFGQQFVQGIWGNVWGEQCYRDLMAVTDALEKRADVDPTRIMAMGGSFGGYMTNWIGTQTQRFRCLVTHASIVTMANFTGTTDHPAWWYLEMGGENPYAEPDRYDRNAPIRHIANWKTPALIIHGEKDYRCPVGESLNLFEALQYHGVESELAIFPDENHWILKPRNAVAWYGQVFGFIGRHMQPR